MNIYSKKQQWKIYLVVSALLIVLASLWYSSLIVKKIAQEERRKVKLWAEAIQKKANLVNYTNDLFNKIKDEERKKVELWAKGTRLLADPNVEMSDVSFVFEVIKNNETVPIILTDGKGQIVSWRNMDSALTAKPGYLAEQLKLMRKAQPPILINLAGGEQNYLYYRDSKLFADLKGVLDDLIRSFISEVAINSASVPALFLDSSKTRVLAFGNIDSAKINTPTELLQQVELMAEANPPIEITLGESGTNYIYYQDSFLLTQLRYYPWIQFGVIGLFLLVAYSLFSTARRSEQNQVWVGMAKETAHQLGTPLSSLMAWLEMLKSQAVDPMIIAEIDKDIQRLLTITDRFSKIGSEPILTPHNLKQVLAESIAYMKARTSSKVLFSLEAADDLEVPLNKPLFEWVIENLIRNAVDAMQAKGNLKVVVTEDVSNVYIEVTDTGKGIPKSAFATVFEPGYTTKKRGWGLGLSLSKRIINNYHKGKIAVKWSELNKGTTFKITLRKG